MPFTCEYMQAFNVLQEKKLMDKLIELICPFTSLYCAKFLTTVFKIKLESSVVAKNQCTQHYARGCQQSINESSMYTPRFFFVHDKICVLQYSSMASLRLTGKTFKDSNLMRFYPFHKIKQFYFISSDQPYFFLADGLL